jgi:hypothetical protein
MVFFFNTPFSNSPKITSFSHVQILIPLFGEISPIKKQAPKCYLENLVLSLTWKAL